MVQGLLMEKLPQNPEDAKGPQLNGLGGDRMEIFRRPARPPLAIGVSAESSVSAARRIYLTAPSNADFRLVADRMYRALLGAKVDPFPRRKGLAGMPMRREPHA
jgi:hypothetical protein